MNITDFIKGDIRSFILTGFLTPTGIYKLNGQEFDELPPVIECNNSKFNLEKTEMKSLGTKCSWGFDATYS